jgi:hypothetical protein
LRPSGSPTCASALCAQASRLLGLDFQSKHVDSLALTIGFAVFKCSDWLVANLTRNPTFLALRERLHPYRILSESGPPFGTIQRFFSLRVLTSGTSCSPPRPHRTSKAATCFFFPISE